jgi:hypothetical protein
MAGVIAAAGTRESRRMAWLREFSRSVKVLDDNVFGFFSIGSRGLIDLQQPSDVRIVNASISPLGIQHSLRQSGLQHQFCREHQRPEGEDPEQRHHHRVLGE